MGDVGPAAFVCMATRCWGGLCGLLGACQAKEVRRKVRARTGLDVDEVPDWRAHRW